MEQMAQLWTGLGLRRQITVVVATVGVFALVLLLSQMASRPRMALLFAGLDDAAAGEVVAALDARNVPMDVRGTSIYVDVAARDALRLSLAGDGLPRNGVAGYELLDTLTGFGTTSQMFDAAYWRAKEGELARTIMSNRLVQSARVHISTPPRTPFQRVETGAASVSLTMGGGALTAVQAMAIRHLVAAAVPGVGVQDVAIIDADRGLIPVEGENGVVAGAGNRRAEAIKASVTRLLEARVGPGKAIVEVMIDAIDAREEFTERRINPDERVQISSDLEETSNRSQNTRNGAVTVASNLPEGASSGADSGSQHNERRTREVVNYEVSETQRQVLRLPGGIRRLSVAVLVDGIMADGNGSWSARPLEELEALRELVASAVGFDEARGDQITIRSMEFQPFPDVGGTAEVAWIDRLHLDATSVIQFAVLAMVCLILGLFVVRPVLTGSRQAQLALPPAPVEQAIGPQNSNGLPAPIDDAAVDHAASQQIEATGRNDDLGKRLGDIVQNRQSETLQVLSQWISEKGEATG